MSVSMKLPSMDLLTGVLLLALSGMLFWACLGIKDFGAIGVGSAFVPRLTAGLLLLVGLVLVAAGWRARAVTAKPAQEADGPRVFGGFPAVALSVALMVGYLALLEPLGYLFASALYGFLQTLALIKDAKRSYLLFAVVAACSAALFFYVFVQLFEISLPSGILG